MSIQTNKFYGGFLKMKQIRFLSLICSFLLILSIISCGKEKDPSNNGTNGGSSSEETTISEYIYPEANLGGRTFTFYSPDEQFNCYVRVDFEEQPSEKLDDAVYKRNRSIEKRYNCKIKEYQATYANQWRTGQQAMIQEIVQMVMSNDSHWDAAYLALYFQPSVINAGYFVDLNTIPELQLDEKWWDKEINTELSVRGHIYAASSPLQFMSLDLAWVLLFNEDIMTDRDIQFPYELVRKGKWTLDEFNKMISGTASLNGADSYTWSKDSPAFYSVATHPECPDAFIFSANNKTVTKEGNDYIFTANTEKMFTTIEKLSKTLDDTIGNAIWGTQAVEGTSIAQYIYIFGNNSSLFLTCELKAALELRNMKSTFGLVPLPKYDENQKSYTTYVNPISCFLTIPVTNPDQKSTAILIDALTYESYRDCMPIYYDVTVSQKGLRNDDSIEMLDIVRSNRSTQMSAFYGITSDLNRSFAKIIQWHEGTTASVIEANSSMVKELINKFLEELDS